MPLSTLRLPPRDDMRKTRGQDGVASPFLWGSFVPYNMPVYPGALRHLVLRHLVFQSRDSLLASYRYAAVSPESDLNV